MMQRGGSSGPSTASRNSREQEETQGTSHSVSRDEPNKAPDTSAAEQTAPSATVETSVAYQYAAVQQMMTNRDHM